MKPAAALSLSRSGMRNVTNRAKRPMNGKSSAVAETLKIVWTHAVANVYQARIASGSATSGADAWVRMPIGRAYSVRLKFWTVVDGVTATAPATTSSVYQVVVVVFFLVLELTVVTVFDQSS